MKKIELDSGESFNIIEIGSDKATLEKVVNYMPCSQNIYCINPNKRDLDDLEVFFKDNNKVNFKKLNFALADVPGKKTFYVTRNDSASSIYEPNQEILKRYRTDNIFDVIEKKEVECEKLDNVFFRENINNVDLLLMLCQASELSILKGGSKILEKISIIHADASFIEKYKKQPLFDDYVSYLSKNNLLILAIAFFISCGNHTDDEQQKTEANNQFKTVMEKTNTSQSKDALPIMDHYKAIGHFDEKNDLIKIDRFLNGKLIPK